MLAIITLIINYYSLFCMSQDWKLDAGAYYSGCYRHPHWWVSLAISTMATGVDSHQHLQPSGWQNSLFLVLGGCLFTVGPGTGLSLYHEMLLIKTRQIIPESPCSVGTENSDTYLKEEMSWLIQAQITRPSQLMKACFGHILVERDKRRGNKFVLKIYFNE